MKDQKKAGIAIQYINIVLNMMISIFITPFLIRSLGDAEYGVYRIVQSFAGQLNIMTFGISTLVTRNIVKYNTLKQQKEKENFLAMTGIITMVLVFGVFIVGFGLSFGINPLYGQSLAPDQLALAKKLYWFLIANVAFTIMNDYVSGIVNGHEKFIMKYGVVTFRLALRIVTLIVLLNMGFHSLAIVATDLALTIMMLLLNAAYGFGKLHEKPKYHFFDKAELKVSLLFSVAILFQAIVNQVNQTLDTMILGAMVEPATVTIYSVGLVLFNAFNTITPVIGYVFIPQATRLIFQNSTREQMTDFCIRPGRLQFLLGCLIVSGFFLFGHKFIFYWVGSGYEGAYTVTMILLSSALVPLSQSMTNPVLNALLKRMGRSIILLCMAVMNVALSIVLINAIGYIGAAIGTAASYVIGDGILNNIYLHKVTNLDLKRMYNGIVTMPLLTTVACAAVGYIALQFITIDSLLMLAAVMVVYIILWAIAAWLLVFSSAEKQKIRARLRKISRLVKRGRAA